MLIKGPNIWQIIGVFGVLLLCLLVLVLIGAAITSGSGGGWEAF